MNNNENKPDDINEPLGILEELMKGSPNVTQDNEEVLKAISEAQKAGLIKGIKVKHIGDNEIGEIVGYNKKTKGSFPGDKYPIRVKFKRGTFEYGIKALEIVK